MGGRVVAFNSQSEGKTAFVHKDMQNTTHMVTGPSGSLIQDQTFYPWGQSWHSLGTWYQQQFAGLDYFDPASSVYFSLSRNYNPTPGRWMSPDPAGLKAVKLADPQTWNMYAYARNNPATLTDPTGLWVWGKCTGDADKCDAERQRFRDSVTNAKKALVDLDPKSKEAKELKKTLDKLGEEGKGRISVSFGDAGKDKNGDRLGRTVGNSITINYDAVDKLASASRLNPNQTAAVDAGLTTHEGTHPGPALFPLLMHTEHAAYFTESGTYQGLHNTDVLFRLWNEDWLSDPSSIETKRENAIQEIIHPQEP